MPRKKAEERPVARLIWVLNGEVTIDAPGPNSTAAQLMIDGLTTRNAIGPLDVAAVSALVSLAMACDAMPADARLWAQYRQAIDALRVMDRPTEDDEDWTSRLGASEVRNPPKPRPPKPRVPSRGGKSAAREVADAAPAARVGRRPRAGT